MKLEITYNHQSMEILGRLDPVGPTELKDYIIKIDGKECPPPLRDIILMGLSYQANLTDRSFAEVARDYLRKLGI